ncbi:BA14K family protein [Bosea sp. 2RAB26]|uniref:BA14K family protein n=1 Tax=Bosea sp. 2RAB26 TaxID=3237476 RepID=UPI003F923D01
MIKTLAIATALLGGVILTAPASAAPLSATTGSAAAVAESVKDLIQSVQYRRYYGPGYGYRGGYYRGGRGAAVGAGIAAGAIGALAAGALLAPGPVYAAPAPVYGGPVYGGPVYASPDADAVAYCARRFRSYDPETGTYIGAGGVVRACP